MISRALAIGFFAGVAALLLAATTTAQPKRLWKPTKANEAPICRNLWHGVGLPRYAKADGRDATLVCRTRFVLMHNNPAKTPDWVVERLKRREVSGKNKRPEQSFVQESRVPPRGRARNDDYTNTKSKFDRGHMAPSEDFNTREAWMRESFVYSNAVPQVGDTFNGAIWSQFEEEVRKIARARGEIYVITGPIRRDGMGRRRTIDAADNACGKRIELEGPEEALICAANNKNPSVACTTGVDVPIALYKVIYDPARKTAYGFILPNRDHTKNGDKEPRSYLDEFRTSIAVVERETGLQFFRDLTDAPRDNLINGCASGLPWVQ